MKLSKILVGAVVLSMMGLAGCGKAKTDSSAVSGGRGLVRGATNTNIPQSNGGAQNPGSIYTNDSAAFTNALKVLVSTTLDPQYLGDVDGHTGVTMSGKVNLQSTGQLATGTSSYIRIEIRDSYSVSGADGTVVPPVIISVPAQTANFQSNGNGDVLFQDQYGWIRLTGSWNQTTFSGTVTFQNTSNATNTFLRPECVANSCTLGLFQVPISSFF